MKTTAKKVAKKVAKKTYTDLQAIMVELMGLEVGNRVTIVREWEVGELGYTGYSVGETGIDVGCEYTVNIIESDHIYLEDAWNYYPVPIFALSNPNQNIIKLNDEYSVEIDGVGNLQVGCVEVEFDLLEKIYNQAKKNHDEDEDELDF
jgi:hypothetical protein